MGRFFPYLGDGFRVKLHWTFWKCLICTTCLVSNMSDHGINDVGKTCVDMKCKKELGWKIKGLSTQRREPPFLLNEGILPRQMDKCSITLAKNC